MLCGRKQEDKSMMNNDWGYEITAVTNMADWDYMKLLLGLRKAGSLTGDRHNLVPRLMLMGWSDIGMGKMVHSVRTRRGENHMPVIFLSFLSFRFTYFLIVAF